VSLQRFTNTDQIISTPTTLVASTWLPEHVQLLNPTTVSVVPDTGIGLPYLESNSSIVVEMQVYAPSENVIDPIADTRIAGGVITDYYIEGNELIINYNNELERVGITRGEFEVVVNVYRNILGDNTSQPFIVSEISPDRREVHLSLNPSAQIFATDINNFLNIGVTNDYIQNVYQTTIDPTSNTEQIVFNNGLPVVTDTLNYSVAVDNLFVNFGENELYRIINKALWTSPTDIILRLYQPLPESIVEDSFCFITELIADSITDNINLSFLEQPLILNNLRGANFENYSAGTVTETDFASYNDILEGSLSVSEQVLNAFVTKSFDDKIKIDYSGLQNFVFYSSAEQRIQNFKTKLETIEFFDQQLGLLNAANSTTDTALATNIKILQTKKNDIIGKFDGFERYLYYESTSSLFTEFPHYVNDDIVVEGGLIGAQEYRLTSWPKRIVNGKFVLHHTTSSLSTNWYNSAIATGSLFDIENDNALVKTIPEFITNDSNNDQYLKFVNMVGHHYDIIYAYVNNIADIYNDEHHPKLGQHKDVYYELAQSLGWQLTNGNQATALSQYALGVDSGSGAFAQTGSLFSKSNEELTAEIWQRMYNNLPYILKTKGSERAIYAIMNVYGIPQSLLSIREYGGPKVGEDQPVLIEDRFAYALKFNSGSNLNFSAEYVSSSLNTRVGSLGIDRGEIPIIKREFRFKPNVKSSMQLYSRGGESTGLISQIGIQYTSSYSGSDSYGRIIYAVSSPDDGTSISGSTDFLPLYDGDIYNLTEFYSTTGNHFNTGSNTDTTYTVRVQKASDFIAGKIIHTGSISLTPSDGSHYKSWASSSNTVKQFLGSYPNLGSNSLGISSGMQTLGGSEMVNAFSGSIQEYREYIEVFDQNSFDIHTLNPTSYVSSLSATSSFDTLVRHYPLGTDLNAVDRSSGPGLIVSSSHPAQDINDFSPTFGILGNTFASASGFETPVNTLRGNYEVIEETYYIDGLSLGGVVPRSEKIRIEDNELISNLSPDRSAETSRFDRAPLDSNRLGLFYSLADQINKDIFNHVGDVALDDFVGDPDDEFEDQYPDLYHFSKHYWKKFVQRNDLNAFLRVFTQFDFGIFSQFSQTIPERVDEVTGILVEPHALERSKVRISKQPTFEDLVTETEIAVTSSLFATSDVVNIPEGSIDDPTKIEGETNYHLSDNGMLDLGNRFGQIETYFSASDYCTIAVYPVDEEPSATASVQTIYSVKNVPESSEWSNLSNVLSLDDVTATLATIHTSSAADSLRLQIDTYSPFETVRDFHLDIVHGQIADPSISPFKINAAVLSTVNNLAGVNDTKVDRSGSFVGRNILEKSIIDNYSSSFLRTDRITFDNIKVEPFTKLTFDLNFAITGSYTQSIKVDKISVIEDINKVCHNLVQQQVYDCRPSNIYKKKIYHFGSQQKTFSNKQELELDRFLSQSLGQFYSSSLETACYMDDFFTDQENLFFDGCKLTGPGINITSNVNLPGIGTSPVVEVYITNPNQLNYTNLASANTAGGSLVVNTTGQPQIPTPFSGINVPSVGVVANPGISIQTNNNQGFGG
jgi:hypothetical protein